MKSPPIIGRSGIRTRPKADAAKLPFAFIEGPLISRSNSIQMKRGIGPLCGVWLARSTSMSSIKHQPIPQEVVALNNR